MSQIETHPYHIITVDCPKKMDNGECMAFTDCTSCYGKGRRRMAVWQLKGEQPTKIHGGMIHFKDGAYDLDITIKEQLLHESDTLPTGETLEEVKLMQAGKLVEMSGITVYYAEKIAESPDTWLPTAFIQEKAE